MMSKKELLNRYNVVFESLAATQRQVKDLVSSQQDICSYIRRMERYMTSTYSTPPEIKRLHQQIQCGVTGHEFAMECAWLHDSNPDRLACFRGRLKCKKCSLIVTRELTPQEITAAKKLGMV